MQMEIIHRAKPQDPLPGKLVADAIHERAAGGAEVVGHPLARGDGARLAVRGQVLAAAHVREMRVQDGEVRGEHRGGDFAAVRAVADEGADEAWGLRGECELHGAAEAGCCC